MMMMMMMVVYVLKDELSNYVDPPSDVTQLSDSKLPVTPLHHIASMRIIYKYCPLSPLIRRVIHLAFS